MIQINSNGIFKNVIVYSEKNQFGWQKVLIFKLCIFKFLKYKSLPLRHLLTIIIEINPAPKSMQLL